MQHDLAMADQLIHAVWLREDSVQSGDFVGRCRLLWQNLQDMTKVREPMARCMTGHDLGENIGQMDASIGDISFFYLRIASADEPGAKYRRHSLPFVGKLTEAT